MIIFIRNSVKAQPCPSYFTVLVGGALSTQSLFFIVATSTWHGGRVYTNKADSLLSFLLFFIKGYLTLTTKISTKNERMHHGSRAEATAS